MDPGLWALHLDCMESICGTSGSRVGIQRVSGSGDAGGGDMRHDCCLWLLRLVVPWPWGFLMSPGSSECILGCTDHARTGCARADWGGWLVVVAIEAVSATPVMLSVGMAPSQIYFHRGWQWW